MGNRFSSRQDLYLHEYHNPLVQDFQLSRMYRFTTGGGDTHLVQVPNVSNPFEGVISPADVHQTAVLTGINLVYVCNEFPNWAPTFELSGMFDVAGDNQDATHPDFTGQIKIICPASLNAPVKDHDRVLYRPRLKEDVIRTYAGLNDAILNPQTVSMTRPGDQAPIEVFDESSPIVQFINQFGHKLSPASGDIVKHGDKHYQVSAPFLTRVREFFKHTIYDDMHYTRFDNARLQCELPPDARIPPGLSVSFVLQFCGILISPGNQMNNHRTLRV